MATVGVGTATGAMGTGGMGTVGMGTAPGRWVLVATIVASGMALLDSTVVNVALPTIGRDLDTGFAGLQWTINGYTLTLAALILLGGSLGDRFGRRRVFVIGTVWFAAASLLCGLAVNIEMLVGARALQGIGGALLTPGSLAIIQASFARADRGRAIGAWSGLGGVATAIGPFLGGYLIDAVSWRLVFLINIPFAVVVVIVALRHVPESHDPTAEGKRLDVTGAVAGALGLGGVTYGLIAAGRSGFGTPLVWVALVVGVAAMVTFVLVERRGRHPMLPVDIFGSRQFTAANLVTFIVYAALGGLFFLLVVQLQTVLGYSALEAGAASLPITALMLLLSARAGALAQRIGPRLPMAAGPLVAGVGMLWLSRIGAGDGYAVAVLPGLVVFGLGLSLTVAPLTATVLAAADDRHSGVASGVNNAVARAAGLLAVAILPLVAGIQGRDYQVPAAFSAGYQRAVLIAGVLLLAGGVLAAATIRNDVLASGPAAGDSARPGPPVPQHHGVVAGPPVGVLEPPPAEVPERSASPGYERLPGGEQRTGHRRYDEASADQATGMTRRSTRG